MDPQIVKMAVVCGISHEHTKYKNHADCTELSQYKHSKYFIQG